MEHQHGFPVGRERPGAPAATLTDRFHRIETSAGFVTLGDADAEVYVFGGVPDRIEVLVELNDAIVTPRTRGHQEGQTITMRAGQSYELDTRYCRIVARNATAGLNARVQVIGRYAWN